MDDLKNLLEVRVISPKDVIFTGFAKSVSSRNSMGKFDILPRHANFITLVNQQPITIIKSTGQSVSFKFDVAIVYTVNNKVNIYTNLQLSLV